MVVPPSEGELLFVVSEDAPGSQERCAAITRHLREAVVVVVAEVMTTFSMDRSRGVVFDGIVLPEQLAASGLPRISVRAHIPFDGETELTAFATDLGAIAIVVPHEEGSVEMPLPLGIPAIWAGNVAADPGAATRAATAIVEALALNAASSQEAPASVADSPEPARRRARQDLPRTATLRARACLDHLRAGRYAEAMEVARALTLAHPEAARGHELLARAALEQGDIPTAVAAAESAARLQPEEPAHHRRLSIARERSGDLDGAIDALASAADDERAIRRAATLRARRARERAEAAIAADDLEDALAHIEEGSRYADEPKLHQMRGVVLRRLGSLTEAAASFARARAQGDDPKLWSQQRMLEGRARTLNPGWLPAVSAAEGFQPGAAVLHLLERSLPSWRSGYTVRSASILHAQREIGLEPVALTRYGFPAFDGTGAAPEREVVDGIVHHRLRAEDVREPKRLPADEYLQRYATAAADVVREVRPRVLHAASGHENALVGLALARGFDLPLVYEVRGFREDSWSADRDRALGSELYEALHRTEAWCMQRADHVVTIAEVMRDDIIARGVDPDRVSVVPNAVDPVRFTPRAPDPQLLASLDLNGKVVVGYVSTLVDFEGVDVLLRALARLPDLGERVAGLIVGGGPELEPLRALARELGIDRHVHLVGEVPHADVLDRYAAIDVFVVPRRDLRVCRLVTPLKPFEAMAMERALIVSDIGALREVVGDGARGLLFPPEDDAALAARILELVDDPARRRTLGETARTWVASERTWRRNAERYGEIYERVLDRHGARPSASR